VDTIQFEAIKTGLRQSKEGYMLTLAVHPDEIPGDLVKDFVGARYMVVMVRLGDDEKPLNREESFSGDHAVQLSGIMCRDPSFWEWLHENEWIHEKNEEVATEWLKDFLEIDSRKNLKTNSGARSLFNDLRKKYESCQKN
jgi:hypothetical protein